MDKLKMILLAITVEPLVIFFMMPRQLSSLSLENLNLEKACLVNLRYNESICRGLVNRDKTAYANHHENEVQKLVAGLITYKTIFDGVVPFFLLIWLGNWRDRTGKIKLILILPFVGQLVACIGYLLCTYFFMETGAEFSVFLETVPESLTGGPQLLFMATFSYIGLISTKDTRTVRMGMISICIRTSVTLGIAVAGYMHKYTGFYGVFTSCFFLYLVGFLFGFLVQELPKKEKVENNDGALRCCWRFVSPINISNMFAVVTKKRDGNARFQIWMLMLLSSFSFGTFASELKVMYMFTRKTFLWNELDYSFFSTYNTIVHLSGVAFGILFFSKYLKWSDAALGLLAVVSKIFESLVQIFSVNLIMFYSATVAGLFGGMILLIIRSMISKLVNPDEMSQINSIISIVDVLVPVAVTPIYTILYQYTVATFPAAIFIVTILFYIPCGCILLWFYIFCPEGKLLKCDTKDEKEIKNTETVDTKV